MTKLKSIDELYKGRHFEREIIILRVRWYLRYKLSYRALVEMMAERGVTMTHSGCSAMFPSSKNAGTVTPERPGSRAVSMRRMSETVASRPTCIAPAIVTRT